MNVPDSIKKAPIIFLTGAGASAPLGLHPTRDFLAYFSSLPLNTLDLRHNVVLSELVTQIHVLAATPGVDIERILSIVERNVVETDHLMANATFVKGVLGGNLAAAGVFRGANEQVRDLIYDEVIAQYSSVDVSKAASLYEELLLRFKAWFSEIAGLGTTIPFFTLNYDVAVETAASKLRVRLVDGLRPSIGAVARQWSPRAFSDYKERADRLTVVLMKLHGSVRWGMRPAIGDGRRVIVELAPHVGRDAGIYKHVVLYPTEMAKPMHVDPFRTLYRIFRESLSNALVLFVIGCSLRDQEIRTSISDAMDDNRKLHLVLVGPDTNHSSTAAELELDRKRVAAVPVKFEPPTSRNFMGMLRGFAQAASGMGVSNAQRAYAFDVTYKTWPAAPRGLNE